MGPADPDPQDQDDLYRAWLHTRTDEEITGIIAVKLDALADVPALLDEARGRGITTSTSLTWGLGRVSWILGDGIEGQIE